MSLTLLETDKWKIEKIEGEAKSSFFDKKDYMLEPIFYKFADYLSKDYKGGFYKFYTITNTETNETAKIMILDSDDEFNMVSPNGTEIKVDAVTFSFIVWLFTTSNASSDIPQVREYYHVCREYYLDTFTDETKAKMINFLY